MNSEKFCKDCKWLEGKRCKHISSTGERDLVTGEFPDGRLAEYKRGLFWPLSIIMGECGMEGRFFEPKEKPLDTNP